MAQVFARVLDGRIDPVEAIQFVTSPQWGGVCLFFGNVRSPNDGRDVDRIEYSAYREMAEAELRRIAEEASRGREIGRVWVAHRTGTVRPGETAVLVAVSAVHRADAFDVCRAIIEELKRRAPIWKHEFHESGSRWVSNP
jgi:molybdopterin synthase catalytic subunit